MSFHATWHVVPPWRSVLEGCTFASPCHIGLYLMGGRFDAFCTAGACKRLCAYSFLLALSYSARVVGLTACQSRAKTLLRRSPVPISDTCRKRVKVGFCDRGNTSNAVESISSSFCVTGAALHSAFVKFRGGRSTWEGHVLISFQAQHVGGQISR